MAALAVQAPTLQDVLPAFSGPYKPVNPYKGKEKLY